MSHLQDRRDEKLRVGRLRIVEDAVGQAAFNHAAVLHHDHAVRQEPGDGEIVGDNDRGKPEIVDEPGSATWYELYAPDAKQARDFYSALLGATADPMPGGLEYYVLKHGDEMLAGVMQIDPAWGDFHPNWITYFSVANTDETAAAVIKHGGRVLGSIEDTPFGRMAAVTDPFGAQFKIIQPPQR